MTQNGPGAHQARHRPHRVQMPTESHASSGVTAQGVHQISAVAQLMARISDDNGEGGVSQRTGGADPQKHRKPRME